MAAMNMVAEQREHDQDEPTVRDLRVMWLFNCIGTPSSLLYWNSIFPPYLERFPQTEFLVARPPAKPIPGTDHRVECVGSWRIPLGKRRNSYDRQYVIASPSIVARIRRSKPDVVVVKELLVFAIYLAAFHRWIGDSKILVMVEGDPFQGRTRKPNRWIQWIRRLVCRRIDYFLTNNQGGKEYLVDQLDVPPSKILARPYLVSHIAARAEAAVGSHHDIPQSDGKLVFLYVGQLIKRKGIAQFFDAFTRLAKENRDLVELWLIGDGDLRQTLEEKVRAAAIQSVVRILGQQNYEKLPEYYDAADVFVMPTLDDYRALVGFEAIGHGLPVLHSIHDGACHEVVEDQVNGRLYDPYDKQQTVDRLKWFLQNRDRLPTMAEKSLERSQQFTVEKAVDAIATAIKNCNHSV